MKFPSSTCLFATLWIAFVPVAGGQVKSSPAAPSDHPVYTLVFKPAGAIPGLTASLFSPPILCSPEGTAYYGVPEPPTYRERTIHQLDLKEPRSFPYRDVEGLYDTHFAAFFPGESELYVLVNATQNSDEASNDVPKHVDPKVLDSGAGGRHDFLLKFDRSGRYDNRIQLSDKLSFYRFAVFEDGSFVALTVDRATAALRLALLSSDGKIERYLHLPTGFDSSGSQPPQSLGKAPAAARAGIRVSKWNFAPVRHKVLLFATDVNQVLEIGQDGRTREVNITIPKGYFFDSVISSNDRWLFHVPRQAEWDPGKLGGGRLMFSDYTLYEVDFNDGRFIRELKGSPLPNLGVACERHGVVTGFSIGRDSKYVLWTAELPD
jgi:hypothetical protein